MRGQSSGRGWSQKNQPRPKRSPASPERPANCAQKAPVRPKSQLFGLDSGDTAFVDVNFFVGELGGVNASYAADA